MVGPRDPEETRTVYNQSNVGYQEETMFLFEIVFEDEKSQ